MKREQSYGIIPLRKVEGAWHVLLIQHSGGHWSFPKGHPEPGETPEVTAARELKEETGLSVDHLLRNSPVTETYNFMWKGTYIHKTVSYYIAEVSGSLVLQVEEIQAAKWVLLDEAEENLTFPAAKAICKEVERELYRS